jgi:excinuclease UvrABC nuclease subunit
VCDSPRYATEYTGEYTSKSDAERIADIARPAGGVGTTNLGNLLATFDHYVEFDVATATELMAIDGIGRKTAENIVNRRDGVTA